MLLGALLAVIFVMPALMSGQQTPGLGTLIVFQVFFALIYVFGITAAKPSRPVIAVALLVAGASMVLFWVDHLAPSPATSIWKAAGRTVTTVFLTIMVLRRVLGAGRITFHRIRGAVAVYLLLGLTWGAIYETIERLWPGAFHLPRPPAGPDDLSGTLAYYSFVTLTTMGYGDILPLHPVARSAAVLEALIGQLFPAILIARLVAMELTAHMSDPPAR